MAEGQRRERMPKVSSRSRQQRRWTMWLRGNWQVLLFWLASFSAGWFLGSKGYGTVLFFHLTGIDPEEWTPILQLTAEKDPKVGSVISLDGLTDWGGKPVRLPFPDKLTALWFTCGTCGLEETLQLIHAFQSQNADKIRTAVVYIGQPNAELFRLWNAYKDLVFVWDPKLTVFERLNALYMPRLYLVAPDGTLRYLSRLSLRSRQIEKWQKELAQVKYLLGK